MTTQTPVRARRRSPLLAALLALCALLLAACGADITTTVTMDSAGAGTRSMTMVFDDSDDKMKDYITGGADAVDASIKKHLPEGIEYKGMTVKGAEYRAEFAVAFTSLEDYESKMASLLKASGSTTEPSIQISKSDTELVKGVIAEENFSSKDLLGWVTDALVEDGVVEESEKSNIISGEGKTTLVMDGKSYASDSTYATLSVNEIKDDGFDGLQAHVAETAEGKYDVSLLFGSNDSIGSVRQQKIDSYFSKATPDGAQVSSVTSSEQVPGSSSYSYGTLVKFTANDLSDLNAKLAKATGSKASKADVKTEASPDSALTFIKSVRAELDCSGACTASPTLSLSYVPLEGWQGSGYQPSGSGSGSAQSFTQSFTRSVSFSSVDVSTELGLGGSVKQTYQYALPAADATMVGKGMESLLSPGENGSFSSEEKDGSMVYTAVVEGSSPDDFNGKIGKYVGGAFVHVNRPSGLHITPEYSVEVAAPVLEAKKLGSAKLTNKLELPRFNELNDEDATRTAGYTVDGQTVTRVYDPEGDGQITPEDAAHTAVVAKGMNIVSFVILGAIALLVLLALALLWFFRKRIGSALSKQSAVAAAKAQEARASLQAQQAAHAAQLQQGQAPAGHGSSAAPAAAQTEEPVTAQQPAVRPLAPETEPETAAADEDATMALPKAQPAEAEPAQPADPAPAAPQQKRPQVQQPPQAQQPGHLDGFNEGDLM